MRLGKIGDYHFVNQLLRDCVLHLVHAGRGRLACGLRLCDEERCEAASSRQVARTWFDKLSERCSSVLDAFKANMGAAMFHA